MNIINLNTNFVNNIGSKWASIISKSRWVVGGSLQNYIYNTNNKTAYNNEINSTFTNVERVYEDKVGLMYVSDYYYGASPSYWTIQGYDEDNSNDYRLAINDNWIFMGLHEFTITRVANTDTAIFFINADGTVRTCQFPIVYGNVFPIRPTFYLNSDVKINGNHSGTKSDPVRLIVNKTF